MPQFSVEVVKRYIQIGSIVVEARNAEAAQAKVDAMMAHKASPLQTVDPRITWHQPDYEDFSFSTTGNVEAAFDRTTGDLVDR